MAGAQEPGIIFGSMKRGNEMTERELPYPNKPVGVGGWLIDVLYMGCMHHSSISICS